MHEKTCLIVHSSFTEDDGSFSDHSMKKHLVLYNSFAPFDRAAVFRMSPYFLYPMPTPYAMLFA